MNSECTTNVKVGHLISDNVNITTGIRQRNSLSLFNLIIDKIIEHLPKTAAYKMGNTYFSLVCYTDDAELISYSEDHPQRTLHAFDQTAQELNIKINVNKTKCLVISKKPRRWKLETGESFIEQVMKFK